MAIGAFLEPLIVVILLFGGAWLNRNKSYNFRNNSSGWAGDLHRKRSDDTHHLRTKPRASAESWSSSSSPVLTPHELAPRRRRRKLQAFGYRSYVSTPNTSVFKDRFLSRVLRKFPFLTEAWYWALIYWVYQLGRAVTALTVVKGTVHVARKHALQVIRWEKSLRIFWELPFQKWFLAHPALLHWVNRVYSFIHIPGTIGFLVVLFYLTTTRQRCVANGRLRVDNAVAGPALYEARRRTMAMCNLIAFIVFTLWPCMPPRLLSDPDYMGGDAEEAKSFGFVDTVHSKAGESSVWTTNKFCNQYAAMPSLHFGYSLLIGLTISTLPINSSQTQFWKRVGMVVVGMSYPLLILTAIVATANHFILDAVAGAAVCAVAWRANDLLLNLCILEDYFLWMLRIHKPVNYTDPETAVDPDFHNPLLLVGEDV